jgi:hypothetical protein
MSNSYVYKWTHLPTMKWYVGSRTAKAAHINDGYICSSKFVKPLIIANPEEWKREIIDTGSKEDMLNLESDILQLFNAAKDPRSFNKSNADGKFYEPATYGMLGKTHSDETKKRMSLKAIAYCNDPLVKSHRSITRSGANNPSYGKPGTMLGQKHTPEALQKMIDYRTGKIYGPRVKSACIHCGFLCAPNIMARYHGDKCGKR